MDGTNEAIQHIVGIMMGKRAYVHRIGINIRASIVIYGYLESMIPNLRDSKSLW